MLPLPSLLAVRKKKLPWQLLLLKHLLLWLLLKHPLLRQLLKLRLLLLTHPLPSNLLARIKKATFGWLFFGLAFTGLTLAEPMGA